MKTLWIFRSNLRILESYHNYKNLQEFKEKCHDFYLLQGIFFLENDYFDEVVIWRLNPEKKQEDITFSINGKLFIQKWVDNFNQCFDYPKPYISFWRGGFPEYCQVTKENPNHFGLKLYLGAGQRTFPKYGGIYDKILVEEEIKDYQKTIPFYKTSNPLIFKPKNRFKIFDICFPSNFTQLRYKGQDDFIEAVSKSNYLKKIRIVHLGNNPSDGENLCEKYKVSNIEFKGWVDRWTLCEYLNQSRLGLCYSNRMDGTPRTITEIISCGIPLLISDKTKLLEYYKNGGVHCFENGTLEIFVKHALKNYDLYKENAIKNLPKISMKRVCEMNVKEWEG